jgi:hypothetical protein
MFHRLIKLYVLVQHQVHIVTCLKNVLSLLQLKLIVKPYILAMVFSQKMRHLLNIVTVTI